MLCSFSNGKLRLGPRVVKNEKIVRKMTEFSFFDCFNRVKK
jgi:hypothetical protein